MKKKLQKELLNIVKKNYDMIASQFSETRKKALWPELIELTKNIKNNDKILDVGCGSGRLLRAFDNKKIDYVGIDSNEKLINFAKKENASINVRNKKFIVKNILKLSEFGDINFDYVYSIAVLHQIPDKNLRLSALKQLKNKIKKDGEIIISVWNMWSPVWKRPNFRKLILKFFLLKILRKNKMDFGDILFDWKNNQGEIMNKRYYHAFTKFELKSLSRKAGLTIKKLYKDNYNYYLILKVS